MTIHHHNFKPTHNGDALKIRLMNAAQIWWDEADVLIDQALENMELDGFTPEVQAEIAKLQCEAETLEAIARGEIEYAIIPNNPKPEGDNGEFIKTVNDYYDAIVLRGLIKGRE